MARRLALVLVLGLVLAAPAAGDNSGKIASLQSRIVAARAHEAGLSSQIATVTSEIRTLESKVGDVSSKLSVLQRDLALHQRRLDKLNALFTYETNRLVQLRRDYALVERQLDRRLVEIYESNDPSLAEVILASSSFQDALDQIHYLHAIAAQDRQIAQEVGHARDEVRVTRAQTRTVRAGVAAETQVISVRTQQQQSLRNQLLASQGRLSSTRGQKQHELAATRETEQEYLAEANSLQAADAAVRARLAAAQSSAPSTGPTDSTPSSSGLIWPVSGPVTSPFGYRWGRLHAGIDIGVGYGTPIHAAASGAVALAGWEGGYGNYTCIDHGGGLATCYAHQSSIAVSVGQHVTQGAVIGYVGDTGHSFGAHLHFEVRINGNPVDPLGYL